MKSLNTQPDITADPDVTGGTPANDKIDNYAMPPNLGNYAITNYAMANYAMAKILAEVDADVAARAKTETRQID